MINRIYGNKLDISLTGVLPYQIMTSLWVIYRIQ